MPNFAFWRSRGHTKPRWADQPEDFAGGSGSERGRVVVLGGGLRGGGFILRRDDRHRGGICFGVTVLP